ncbi:hypothetical protein D3C78_1277520 [compost metagenome]
MLVIFLIDLRTVVKLVNIPPNQRSVTKGMFTLCACAATMSLACFLVATNNTLRPDLTICLIAEAASSTLTKVLFKSIMWIPFFSMKMYGAIFGFHLRVR